MDPARPLRDVFADLVGDQSTRQAHAADPEGFLTAAGHPELPGDLVAEAIVNYADTAPAEVAEHLAPFVMANGPVPVDEGALPGEMDWTQGLDLLAGAPGEVSLDDDLAVDPHAGPGLAGHEGAADDPYAGDSADPHAGVLHDDPSGLDFGHGDTDLVHTGRLGDVGDAPAGELGGLDGPAELDHAGELDDAGGLGDSGGLGELDDAGGLDGLGDAPDQDLPDRDPADGLDDL